MKLEIAATNWNYFTDSLDIEVRGAILVHRVETGFRYSPNDKMFYTDRLAYLVTRFF